MIINILFVFMTFFITTFVYSASPSATELKSLEVLIQANQIFLALVSACLAYLLHHAKEIKKIYKSGDRGLSIFIIGVSFVSLLIVALLHVWDLRTVSNQLRNDFLQFDDFINDSTYLIFISVGMLAFFYSSWVIAGEKND